MKELREAAGLTQTDLADRIGVTWQTISRIENAHTRIMPKHEKNLARELKVDPGALYSGDRQPPRQDPPSNASPPVPIPHITGTIPMLGSGVAGLDGKFVLNGNRIMDVLCPPQLAGVPDAYGVFVHGGSMEPRYHPGEAVFVNPHLPVRQTDYVVVQIAEEDESQDMAGYVKRFVSMNSRELVLEQYQPREDAPDDVPEAERFTMRFDRKRVVAVHKIVGSGIV